MTIVLIVLNIIFLFFNLAFNAQLLDLAASDITLIEFERIAKNGQLLSAFGMTLLAWRLLSSKFAGKKLAAYWAGSFILVYPASLIFQDVIPEMIMHNLDYRHKAASVYAYVVKKGYVSNVITFKDIESFDKDDSGATKSLVANMGILLNADSVYLKNIDKDFTGFTTLVFTKYWTIHADDLYQRFRERSVEPVKEIIKLYAEQEAHRNSLPVAQRLHHAPVALDKPAFADNAQTRPHLLLYARAMPVGIKTVHQLISDSHIQMMAQSVLGPLYVKNMNVVASEKIFRTYIPAISQNMASEVAATDLEAPEGKAIIKNMIFLPFTLATSLFMGIVSIVVLTFALIEAINSQSKYNAKIKGTIICSILIAPLVIGNPIVNSDGYASVVEKSGEGMHGFKYVIRWAMVTEGWLYDLKEAF